MSSELLALTELGDDVAEIIIGRLGLADASRLGSTCRHFAAHWWLWWARSWPAAALPALARAAVPPAVRAHAAHTCAQYAVIDNDFSVCPAAAVCPAWLAAFDAAPKTRAPARVFLELISSALGAPTGELLAVLYAHELVDGNAATQCMAALESRSQALATSVLKVATERHTNQSSFENIAYARAFALARRGPGICVILGDHATAHEIGNDWHDFIMQYSVYDVVGGIKGNSAFDALRARAAADLAVLAAAPGAGKFLPPVFAVCAMVDAVAGLAVLAPAISPAGFTPAIHCLWRQRNPNRFDDERPQAPSSTAYARAALCWLSTYVRDHAVALDTSAWLELAELLADHKEFGVFLASMPASLATPVATSAVMGAAAAADTVAAVAADARCALQPADWLAAFATAARRDLPDVVRAIADGPLATAAAIAAAPAANCATCGVSARQRSERFHVSGFIGAICRQADRSAAAGAGVVSVLARLGLALTKTLDQPETEELFSSSDRAYAFVAGFTPAAVRAEPRALWTVVACGRQAAAAAAGLEFDAADLARAPPTYRAGVVRKMLAALMTPSAGSYSLSPLQRRRAAQAQQALRAFTRLPEARELVSGTDVGLRALELANTDDWMAPEASAVLYDFAALVLVPATVSAALAFAVRKDARGLVKWLRSHTHADVFANAVRQAAVRLAKTMKPFPPDSNEDERDFYRDLFATVDKQSTPDKQPLDIGSSPENRAGGTNGLDAP